MSHKTLSKVVVVVLAAILTISACQYLMAGESATDASKQVLPTGNYTVTLTTGPMDAKLISKAELTEIGGRPFLKCTLIDTDALKEAYRGTVCFVAVDQIVSIQELPTRK